MPNDDDKAEVGLSPEMQKAFDTILSWQTPEGQRAQRRMEEIRPQWDELGSTLVTHAALTYKAVTGRDVEAGAAGADLGLVMVRDGSPAQREADESAFPQINPDNELVLDVLRSLLAGAIDHLLAVGLLMMASAPIRPTFSSARVLLEAGARTHTLAGAKISPRTRVTRAANFRLEDLHQQKTDLTHAGDVTDANALAEIQIEMDRLTTAGDRDGLTPQVSKKGDRQIYFLPLHTAEDAANESLLPGLGRDTWRTLSSAVHLQERGAYLDFALNKIAVVSDRIRRAYGVGQLQSAYFVVFQGLESACEYLGADVAAMHDHFDASWQLWDRGSMSESGSRLNRAILAEQDCAGTDAI